jgi:hypothetical protein
MTEPTAIRGVLGWGNRKSGLEVYGPDGRWGGTGRDGDLLGDALARAGQTEGASLVVVAVPRFGDTLLLDAVLALVADATGDAGAHGSSGGEVGHD